MFSKQYGDAWVFFPIPCWTGALHAQPNGPTVRLEACGWFTADYKVHFDCRGALDAPNMIPSGSVRALDFGPPSRDCLLIGHGHREGWLA